MSETSVIDPKIPRCPPSEYPEQAGVRPSQPVETADAAGCLGSPQADDWMAVFSLPLTTFEQYRLWDDRPEYAKTFFVRLERRGRVCREAFVAAVDAAILNRVAGLQATMENGQTP